MRKLLLILALAILILGLAAAYSGDVTIGTIATTGNSTNYSITAADAVIAANGSSDDHSLTVEAYAYDAEKDTYVPPGDDDDDDSGGSSTRSSGPSFFPVSSVSPPESDAVEIVSFSSLVSTEGDALVVTSPRESDMFQTLNISTSVEMRNVQFRVVESTGVTDRVELTLFKGAVYKLLDIQHDAIPEEDITRITLTFKVAKDWVDGRNADPDNVTLFRYDGFAWQALETRHERTDANFHYFSALSPGLSTFLVGLEDEQEAQTEDEGAVTLITGNAVDNSTGNETAPVADDPWADYEEPRSSLAVPIIVLVVLIGGGVAAFFYLKKRKQGKDAPLGERPAGSPAAMTLDEKQKFPVGDPTKQLEKKEHISFDDEPQEQQEDASSGPKEVPPTEEPSEPIEEKPDFTDDDESVLTNFIQSLLDKGFMIEQFKPKLIVKGWSQKQIDHCLQKLGKR